MMRSFSRKLFDALITVFVILAVIYGIYRLLPKPIPSHPTDAEQNTDDR